MAPLTAQTAPAREIVAFEVRAQPDRESIHLAPVGELDVATVARLRGDVEELIAAGFAGVVIDLRELTFIDCAGLRLLLALDDDARRAGWRLALIQGSESVRRLFELTGTLDVLPFSSSNRQRRRDAHDDG